MTIEEILVYLTPFLIWAATWLFQKIAPLIPGWLTITVVTILSAIYTWLVGLVGNPELAWYGQFLLGLLAIVLNEFIKQFSPEKRLADKKARELK